VPPNIPRPSRLISGEYYRPYRGYSAVGYLLRFVERDLRGDNFEDRRLVAQHERELCALLGVTIHDLCELEYQCDRAAAIWRVSVFCAWCHEHGLTVVDRQKGNPNE